MPKIDERKPETTTEAEAQKVVARAKWRFHRKLALACCWMCMEFVGIRMFIWIGENRTHWPYGHINWLAMAIFLVGFVCVNAGPIFAVKAISDDYANNI